MALAERGKADTDLLLANTAAYTLTVAAWNAVPLNQCDDTGGKKVVKGVSTKRARKK